MSKSALDPSQCRKSTLTSFRSIDYCAIIRTHCAISYALKGYTFGNDLRWNEDAYDLEKRHDGTQSVIVYSTVQYSTVQCIDSKKLDISISE